MDVCCENEIIISFYMNESLFSARGIFSILFPLGGLFTAWETFCFELISIIQHLTIIKAHYYLFSTSHITISSHFTNSFFFPFTPITHLSRAIFTPTIHRNLLFFINEFSTKWIWFLVNASNEVSITFTWYQIDFTTQSSFNYFVKVPFCATRAKSVR